MAYLNWGVQTFSEFQSFEYYRSFWQGQCVKISVLESSLSEEQFGKIWDVLVYRSRAKWIQEFREAIIIITDCRTTQLRHSIGMITEANWYKPSSKRNFAGIVAVLCSFQDYLVPTIFFNTKVLCYKSEGRWFDSRWCHWNFSLT
jgi:hypothetical protein